MIRHLLEATYENNDLNNYVNNDLKYFSGIFVFDYVLRNVETYLKKETKKNMHQAKITELFNIKRILL